MALVNTADFSMGFWIVAGAVAAILVLSLLMGAFRKVA